MPDLLPMDGKVAVLDAAGALLLPGVLVGAGTSGMTLSFASRGALETKRPRCSHAEV